MSFWKSKNVTGQVEHTEQPEKGAGIQATAIQATEDQISSVKRGTGWMKQDEKILGEFGGAHVYNKFLDKVARAASFNAKMAYGAAKHPIGGGYVSRYEARMDSNVRSAQDRANQANAQSLKIDSTKTVITDRRIVFLDKDENILLELILGLENVRKHIQNLKTANEEAEVKAEEAKKGKGFFDKKDETKKKYGYVENSLWAYGAAIDDGVFKHDELVIFVGHFAAPLISKIFNPKYSDGAMRRGWKLNPSRSIMYGPFGDYNVRLSEPGKTEEMVKLLKSMTFGVSQYTNNKTDMIVDFLGRKPDWLA